jgi:hypothetical protein
MIGAMATLPPVMADLDTIVETAIRTGGETDRFDFKESLDPDNDEHKIRLVRAVGAFGNTDDGGYILLGISDARQVVGLPDSIVASYDQTRIQSIIAQYLVPPPSVQVRQHQRDGKALIVIEVSGFREIPSIVTRSVTVGKERLQAGTILRRTAAAQSAVLASELELRRLCDAIAKRRAVAIVELFQKGMVGLLPGPSSRDSFAALRVVRTRADRLWSSAPGSPPYVEGAFASAENLALSVEDLKKIIPGACVPIKHGYPFYDVSGSVAHTSMPWGWLGAIPYTEEPKPEEPLSYLWLLMREGAFLYCERLWEDLERSVIPGGVGLFHVAGQAILLIRFLDRVANAVGIPSETLFKLSVVVNNTTGRYMSDERSVAPRLIARKTNEPRVEASLETTLDKMRSARWDVAANLLR